jgi:hypothetical protein
MKPSGILVAYAPRDELLGGHQRSKVLSAVNYRGLPNSLCEAMLCGCVPVGTRLENQRPSGSGIPRRLPGPTWTWPPRCSCFSGRDGRECAHTMRQNSRIERREESLCRVIDNYALKQR